MGGHAAGEVASEMAVQTIERELDTLNETHEKLAPNGSRSAPQGESTIHDRTIAEVDKQGMGTTASVLLIWDTHY
jgi:protein phosphatase